MNISATLDGVGVNIVDVDVNGNDIYVTFVDSTTKLIVTKKFLDPTSVYTTIATSATIV